MARTIPIDKLLEAIKHVGDDQLIIDLYHRLGIKIEKTKTYPMSKDEMDSVNEGLSQFDKGESVRHEDVMKKAKKVTWSKQAEAQFLSIIQFGFLITNQHHIVKD